MFNELASRFLSIDFKVIFIEVVKELEDLIINLNTEDQLYLMGVDSEGRDLPGPYAPFTVQYKQSSGDHDHRTANITLKDTGSFYKGWKIIATNEFIEFTSTDSKTIELVHEWGVDIFGLTDENWNEVINQYVIPAMIDRTLKHFNFV